jgi:hypothetical protein
LQFPKCKTKQGFIQSERKIYTDLLYDTNINGEITEWLSNLEIKCQELIYNKKNTWFHNDLTLNDIENAFNNTTRLYKAGKLFLIRCHINKSLVNNKINCNIYDEDERILTINDITIDKYIIPLVKICLRHSTLCSIGRQVI